MSDELNRRSHELFKRAVEVDEGLRSAFVTEHCNGDQRLRQRVLTLLAALHKTQDFLEVPAIHASSPSRPAEGVDVRHDIPGYRMVGVIGQGGMARVYEAIQEHPHRRVALKVMNHGLTQASAQQRFEFETEVLARLRHPNIAQIFEAGSFLDAAGSAIPYFAMEHVPGARPLTVYADEQGLGFRERLKLLATVCDAVQHGHQNGVIHRDLKPGNVLVDAAGHPKVIDFGVARSTDSEQAWITRHAEFGQLIGTLNYMSPEQCAGTMDVDVRTDVYSLGMMLYELLCGRLPHDLTRVPFPEALRIVQRDAPRRPSAVKPALKGDIEAIILKAIDKDPDRRYSSAAALAADLGRFLRNETIEARSPTLLHQARLFTRRHRTMVVAATAIAVSLVLATVLSAAFAYRAATQARLRKQAELSALALRDTAVWRSYVAYIAAAGAALRSDELQFARRNLREAPEMHRNWEWRFLNESAERSAQTIRAHDDMIFAFDVSRDGTKFVTGSRDGTIRVHDAHSRRTVAQTDDQDTWILAVAFDRDANRIVSGSQDHRMQLWDAKTGNAIRLIGQHAGSVDSVAFGIGNVIASASEDGAGRLWDAENGTLIREISPQPNGIRGVSFTRTGDRLLTYNRNGILWVRSADATKVIHRLAFPGSLICATTSPDDRLLAAGGADGQFTLWNLETGAVMHTYKTEGSVSSVRSLAFTPDGRVIASGQTDRLIRLWSVESGQELPQRFRGHEETVSGLTFSNDQTQLISCSWDRTIRVWEYSGPGKIDLVTTLGSHDTRVISARFSPDESIVASSSTDGCIRIWDPELGTLLGTLRGHEGDVYALGFSPDGSRLASGSHDRTIRLWNATTGGQEMLLKGHTGHIWSVGFSPDGRLLASGGNDSVIRIWDLQNRQTISTYEGHSSRVTCVQFSPDGQWLASASRDHSVRLWNITTREMKLLQGHTLDVYAVAFSADGLRLYSGSRDQTVRVWNAHTGEWLYTLDGHGQMVTSLSINPAGDRLAAGSWYGEIVLWDLRTMDIVLSFKAHEEVIRSVVFGPGGRWLASASYDGTVRLFDDAPQSVRMEKRRNAADQTEAAAAIADRLVTTFQTPEAIVQALDDGTQCESSMIPWVRKSILKKLMEPDREVAPPTRPAG